MSEKIDETWILYRDTQSRKESRITTQHCDKTSTLIITVITMVGIVTTPFLQSDEIMTAAHTVEIMTSRLMKKILATCPDLFTEVVVANGTGFFTKIIHACTLLPTSATYLSQTGVQAFL